MIQINGRQECVKAAVYAHISRDEFGEALGVGRQQDDCRAICDRRGWPSPRMYVDNDVSAYSGRTRPEYRRLLADVEAGAVDVVLAWAPERLHRSPRELEDFLELIEHTGTAVETIKAGAWDVTTSHGRLVARMLGAVSRAESERTGERVSRAHQQAKEHGLWRGPIPYGMKASKTPGLPEPDEEQARIVEEIFRRVLRGEALTAIALDLNNRGLRPRRGTAWTHTGLSRLINSPALGGLLEIDGELRQAAFVGVFAPDEWRAARGALRRRPRGEARRPREKLTLLGGLLTCAEHGHKCVGTSATHGQLYGAGQPGQCHVSIKRAAADDLVTEVLLRRLEAPDAAVLLEPERTENAVDTQIQQLRLRREELADLVADGSLPSATARPRLNRIAEQLRELEARRSPPVVDPQLLVDPRSAWSRWTMPQRRELLRLLFDSITVRHAGPRGGPRADPTRISLNWSG